MNFEGADNYTRFELNEITSKLCSNKSINDGITAVIRWKNRNIKSLFPLKDKNDWDCFCGSRFIDETKCNAEVRWNEHKNPAKGPELLKYLWNNMHHWLTWCPEHLIPPNLEAISPVWNPPPSPKQGSHRFLPSTA